MVTDLSTKPDRKQQVAEMTGRNPFSVKMQLDVLKKQGLLIDLNISGTGMFTKTASFDEVGFAQDVTKDVRFNWIRPGTKYIIPEMPVKKLLSVVTRMRQVLEKYTYRITGFAPWRWLPFTAYEQFTESWKKLLDEFEQVKEEIIDSRDAYVDIVAEQYSLVALASWGSIKAQGYKFPKVDGQEMDKDSFVDYVVAKAVSVVPEAEVIQAKLQADYITGVVYSAEDVAMDELRAAQVNEQLNLSRQLTEIEVSAAQERARGEAWKIQADQQEREIKIQAMLQAEAEHAREQLSAIASPFSEVFTALRAQIGDHANQILQSIKKNGMVRGKVAERGRGLIEIYNLMACHDDKELQNKLIALKSQLGEIGTKQDDESRDVNSITTTLEEIMELEKNAVKDLLAGPSRFSFAEV